MGCDFQEGFKAFFNCSVLKDTAQPGSEDGPGRGFWLAHRELVQRGLVPKVWELPSPLLNTEKVTLGGPGQTGCRGAMCKAPSVCPASVLAVVGALCERN